MGKGTDAWIGKKRGVQREMCRTLVCDKEEMWVSFKHGTNGDEDWKKTFWQNHCCISVREYWRKWWVLDAYSSVRDGREKESVCSGITMWLIGKKTGNHDSETESEGEPNKKWRGHGRQQNVLPPLCPLGDASRFIAYKVRILSNQPDRRHSFPTRSFWWQFSSKEVGYIIR